MALVDRLGSLPVQDSARQMVVPDLLQQGSTLGLVLLVAAEPVLVEPGLALELLLLLALVLELDSALTLLLVLELVLVRETVLELRDIPG